MGIFGKIFDKKVCDICGKEIGLLGNRKLEDGNCCKECAAKLSPWFNERRSSTVADIKNQLEYREANKQEVAAFQPTKTLGNNTKIMFDENQGKFLVVQSSQWRNANPDVMKFSQVTGCNFDIDEEEHEEKRQVKNADGTTKEVSYNPPRYHYTYDFYITIQVNNPYFDQIRFKLNNHTVKINPNQIGMGSNGRMNNNVNSAAGFGMMGGVLQGVASAMANPQNMAQGLVQGLAQGMQGVSQSMSGYQDPKMNNPEYAQYCRMGEDIRNTLMQVHQQVRDEAAAAAAPKTAMTCPWCGATTIPDANGCCEYCGGSMMG